MHTTRHSLLLRIKCSEDNASWAEFDGIYRPMLRRFALSRGLDDASADDVVQHCMISVHEHIRGFEYDPSKGRFKSWLRTLVNNRVRNLHRDRHEQSARTGDFVRGQARELPPEEAFDRIWMEEHLRHCMRRVRDEETAEHFEAYRAYAIDEKPVEEVCGRYGLSANQLYKLKWRITQRLTELMKDLVEVPE